MVDWRNVYISFRGLAFLVEEENKKFDLVSPEDKWKNPEKKICLIHFRILQGRDTNILLVIFSSSAIGSTAPVVQQHFLEEEYESHQLMLFTACLGVGVLPSACCDQ